MKDKIIKKLASLDMAKVIKSLTVSFIIAFISLISIFDISSDFLYSVAEVSGTQLTDLRDLQLSEIEVKMKEDFEELYKKNNELIGMLNIPGVGYFPVMYTGDQKYISTDFDGNYKFAGVPFMNRNSFGRFEEITLIHAHTMVDGSMFTSLRNFKDKDFFQMNPPITVYDGKFFYYYKPFTVLNIQDGTEFIKQKGMTDKEQEEYLKGLKKRSLVPTEEGIEFDFTQDALFLQTCDYNFYNSRLIVGSSLIYKKESGVSEQ